MKLLGVFVSADHDLNRVFIVNADESDWVTGLKIKIKQTNPQIVWCDPIDIALYVAKRGADSWLPQEEAMRLSDLREFERVVLQGVSLESVGLSEAAIAASREGADQVAPVNVLVVVPPKRRSKPEQYKAPVTNTSSRKFLDAVARYLHRCFALKTETKRPTIDDVLRARSDPQELRPPRLYYGMPTVVGELPDIFTADEWKELEDLNVEANARTHDGIRSTRDDGSTYIVVSRGYYAEDRARRLQQIAIKSLIVFDPDDIEVLADEPGTK